ncbi:uncharacterized protein [Acropora muricata]|uniref:uncharacterized protein isoform X1 n=2 Tax=Acropora muricata TaxID=159855 RepID=UPI0034E3E9ED
MCYDIMASPLRYDISGCTGADMTRLTLVWFLICLALVVDTQEAEKRTEGDITEEEEPHPYTISFFLFPNKETENLIGGKENKTNRSKPHDTTKRNTTKGSGEQADTLPEDDTEISYQHGSVWHPAHEMYPMCHHCPKNSTYEDCVHKRTLKRCDNGLFNICFTKSTKRDTIVHYNMGCANHKQCQRARAKPCKAHEKQCFTCCQWSGCNSISHHGGTTSFSSWNTAQKTKLGWGTAGINIAALVLMHFM